MRSFYLLMLDSSLVSPAQHEFQMDFDVVVKNIRELNILAGEGCSDVSRTRDGARLKVDVLLNLKLKLILKTCCYTFSL